MRKIILLTMAVMSWIFVYNPVFSQIQWDSTSINFGNTIIKRAIKPEDYKLYSRNESNEASVRFKGSISTGTSLSIEMSKTDSSNNTTTNVYNVTLDGNHHFDHSCTIQAELSEYKFRYRIGTGSWNNIADHVVCGDVYLIEGQSNACAYIYWAYTGPPYAYDSITHFESLYGSNTFYGKYSRSYGRDYSRCNDTAWHYGLLNRWGRSAMMTDSGNFWVGAWGMYVQYKIQQKYKIPTCVINGSRGQTRICEHLPDAQNIYNIDTIFGNFIYRVYKAGLENSIKGLIWYQGEGDAGSDDLYGNNSTEDTTKFNTQYIKDFQNLHEQWRKYISIEKTYVFQLYPHNSTNNNWTKISNFQRLLQDSIKNLEVMPTNGVGCRNEGVHFFPAGYERIGNRLFKLIGRDMYGETNNITDITPPNIKYANFESGKLVLEFDQNISTSLSDPLDSIKKYIGFNISNVTISNLSVNENKFSFTVSDTTMKKVHYIVNAGKIGNSIGTIDYKCYLRNSKGIGAFSFYDFPIVQKVTINKTKTINADSLSIAAGDSVDINSDGVADLYIKIQQWQVGFGPHRNTGNALLIWGATGDSVAGGCIGGGLKKSLQLNDSINSGSEWYAMTHPLYIEPLMPWSCDCNENTENTTYIGLRFMAEGKASYGWLKIRYTKYTFTLEKGAYVNGGDFIIIKED